MAIDVRMPGGIAPPEAGRAPVAALEAKAPRRFNVGARIRYLRTQKGWSMRELSERTGLDLTLFSAVERSAEGAFEGKARSVQVGTAEKVAAAFGLTLAEFFDEDNAQEARDLPAVVARPAVGGRARGRGWRPTHVLVATDAPGAGISGDAIGDRW